MTPETTPLVREMLPRFVARVLPGLAVATVLAWAAYRARLLRPGGAVIAVAIGAGAFVAGPEWVILLLFFFVTSSLLSRWRAASKAQATGSIVEKPGPRDAWQVVANGAVFAMAALAFTVSSNDLWRLAGAGAIATATADTWSTEIGTAFGGSPRHVLHWRPIPVGTSGGISFAGTLAALAGTGLTALLVGQFSWGIPLRAVAIGGLCGAVADSLLGAAIQERRWCDACGVFTERTVHDCGQATVVRGGIRAFGNDAVNLTSVIVGAVMTVIFS